MPVEKTTKLKIALEYQLLGAKYYSALKAFNLAQKYHCGVRKDGITPEFKHQLDICHFILTLNIDEKIREIFITSALLHDIREDYEIEHSYITDNFGETVGLSVELLTKKFKGVQKSYEEYFDKLANNKYASIVKGVDRINNISTMIGVFDKKKQLSYIKEVETYFLPMLKKARKKFPELSYAYLNIETVLKYKVMYIKEVNK